MSGDPEQEYFADGMVEEITTALSRFKSLFVIARNSSFTFKGKAVDIKEVGRRLGVRYVLEGAVRKASGKVRITSQLIEVATGTHIWADRFERDMTDIFALQDDVTLAVVSAIQPKLFQAEMARIATEGVTSLEWLKPFMTERKYRSGDILFKKDDAATEMFLTVTGKFLIREIDVVFPPGCLMGELGLLTPNKRRTATVECTEDGQVMTITYDRLLEIYFQNPQFGNYFLVLTSQRLLGNISRLEGVIAEEKPARQTLATNDIA